MSLKTKYITLFLITIMYFANAQDTINFTRVKKNNISIEIGGTSLLYSIHYERILFVKAKQYQSAQIGVGAAYLYGFFYGVDQIFIPVDYTIYLGKGRLKLLAGLGVVGLIGTNPSPGSFNARQDYLKLYNTNQYSAISKYGTDHFEKAFDLAYTAKLGFKIIGNRLDYYAYCNCSYIRFSTKYNFNPVWFGTGISIKLNKKLKQ